MYFYDNFYIITMNNKLRLSLLIFIIFAGIIGMGFIVILDEPDHIIQPDPNCPLCLAAQTYFIFASTFIFFSLIQFLSYIIGITKKKICLDQLFYIFSSRAPPSLIFSLNK